jgi:hypothetical protein
VALVAVALQAQAVTAAQAAAQVATPLPQMAASRYPIFGVSMAAQTVAFR